MATNLKNDYKFFIGQIPKIKKLRATWTPEMAQDLNAQHAIDIEADLNAIMSREIARTVDNEIINELFNIPQINNWSTPNEYEMRIT